MHLQEVVTGASSGQLEEIQADAAPSARRDREGEKKAGWRQVVCLHALARGAGLDERLHGCREAWPPYGAADQGEGLVASEVATERSLVKLPQHLRAELARRWDAQAVAARALTVEQPIARDEEAGPRAGSWAGRAGSGDRVGGVGLGGGEERAQEGISQQGGAEGCSELRVQEAGGVGAGARMGEDRSSGIELERRAWVVVACGEGWPLAVAEPLACEEGSWIGPAGDVHNCVLVLGK